MNSNRFSNTPLRSRTAAFLMRKINLIESSIVGSAATDWMVARIFGSTGSGDGQLDNPFGSTVYDSEFYVVDNGNKRVQVFTPAGVFQRKWGSFGTGDGQFNGPTFLCVYNDEVYVADTGNNRVQVFNTAGTYQRQWGGSGTGNGQFNSPAGIDVYGSEIYVVDAGNNRVQVFNTSGTYQRQWGSSGSGDGQFLYALCLAAYGGEIYVTDALRDDVQVFNTSGTYQRTIGSSGSGDGQFDNPYGIDIDDDGLVYVVDAGNNRVEIFDTAGNYVDEFAVDTDAAPGITVAAGEVYVSRIVVDEIKVYASDEVLGSFGSYVSEFASPPGSGTRFASGVFANASGIYVADNIYDKLYQCDANGNVLNASPAYFNLLSYIGIAADASGNIYHAHEGSPKIYKLTSSLSALANWSSGSYPQGLAFDSNNYLYVADPVDQKIYKYTTSGSLVTSWGTSGTNPGEFQGPRDIAVNTSDEIYVVDYLRLKVIVFNTSGSYQREFGTSGTNPGEFQSPNSIAFDANDYLYVLDGGREKVILFDDVDTYSGEFGTSGTNPGEFDLPVTCYVYGGVLYVTDANRDKVIKFASNENLPYPYTQTIWYYITSARTELPMGVPDGGVYVPDDHALYRGPHPDDVPAGEHYDDAPWLYLTQLRDGVEALARSGAIDNPATGSPFNWTPSDANNLHYVAMTPYLSSYNLTSAGYTWKRTLRTLQRTEMLDIDVGEIYHCVDTLYRACVIAGRITP